MLEFLLIAVIISVGVRERKEIILMSTNRDVVQTRNPRSGHYVKIDRSAGRIIAHKSSAGPYKGVPVARRHAK